MVTHKYVNSSCALGPRQSQTRASTTGSVIDGYRIGAVPRRERFAQTGKCTCNDWPGSQLAWKPSSSVECRLPLQWEARAFCKELGERQMHFIGDSTMFQIAATLMNRIVLDAATIVTHENLERTVPVGGNLSVARQRLLECAGQVSFATSDTLIGRNLGYFNRGKMWAEEVRAERLNDCPSIVILGANQHVGRGVDYRQLLVDVATLIPSFTNITFFWATSVPGGCAVAAAAFPPGASPRSWEAAMNSSYHDVNNTQNLPELYSRDQLAIDFWSGTHVRVINLLALHLRPDAHPGSFLTAADRDCRHLCIPGPLDHVVPRQVLDALGELG